ncbi:DUF5979 domain-containing protein [Eubacteriales bacterium OttesenSCG-928-N13]|nr:DUF5979 domain-containing protein [Eubacteriales bacterium OttesenSCG-928-N13]
MILTNNDGTSYDDGFCDILDDTGVSLGNTWTGGSTKITLGDGDEVTVVAQMRGTTYPNVLVQERKAAGDVDYYVQGTDGAYLPLVDDAAYRSPAVPMQRNATGSDIPVIAFTNREMTELTVKKLLYAADSNDWRSSDASTFALQVALYDADNDQVAYDGPYQLDGVAALGAPKIVLENMGNADSHVITLPYGVHYTVTEMVSDDGGATWVLGVPDGFSKSDELTNAVSLTEETTVSVTNTMNVGELSFQKIAEVIDSGADVIGLAGAQFELSSVGENRLWTEFVDALSGFPQTGATPITTRDVVTLTSAKGTDDDSAMDDGIITLKYLPYGTYQLVETVAPFGYQRDLTERTVTVAASGTIISDAPDGLIENEPSVQTDDITFFKKDAFGQLLQGAVFALDRTVSNPDPLQGGDALWHEMAKAKAEEDGDDDYAYDAGNHRLLITSDASGEIVVPSALLIVGDYSLVEVAQQGYALSDASYGIEVGTNVQITYTAGSMDKTGSITSKLFTNTLLEGPLTLKKMKRLGSDPSTAVVNAAEVEVGFTLEPVALTALGDEWDAFLARVDAQTTGYVATEGSMARDDDDDEALLLTSDAGTGVVSIPKLPYGSYTLTEVNTPDGLIAMDPHTIVISEAGASVSGTDIDDLVQGANANTLNAINDLDTEDLKITKQVLVNGDTEDLTGAVFRFEMVELTDGDEMWDVYLLELVETDYIQIDDEALILTIDNSGQVIVPGLPDGNYTLTETDAPLGYALPSAAWAVTVDEQGALITGTTFNEAMNEPMSVGADLTFYKEDNFEQPRAGAQFSLTRAEGASTMQHGEDVWLDRIAVQAGETGYSLNATQDALIIDSDADGEIVIPSGLLVYGTYTLIETAAPAGYTIGQQTFTITVTEASATALRADVTATNEVTGKEDTFINTLQEGSMDLLKLLSDGDMGAAPLGDVQFELEPDDLSAQGDEWAEYLARHSSQAEDGKLILTTDADGVAEADGLPLGSYTLTERLKPGFVGYSESTPTKDITTFLLTDDVDAVSLTGESAIVNEIVTKKYTLNTAVDLTDLVDDWTQEQGEKKMLHDVSFTLAPSSDGVLAGEDAWTAYLALLANQTLDRIAVNETNGTITITTSDGAAAGSVLGQNILMDLPVGSYTLTQLSVDGGGYELLEDPIDVTIPDDADAVTWAYNPPLVTQLDWLKLNQYGMPLDGVEFTIDWVSSAMQHGEDLIELDSMFGSDKKDVAETDENGLIHSGRALLMGAYTITETGAPDGYEGITTTLDMNVDAEGNVTGDLAEGESVINELIEGSFRFHKRSRNDGLLLAGAVYQLRMVSLVSEQPDEWDEYIARLANAKVTGVSVSQGTILMTTDANGAGSVTGLPLGEYEFQEYAPPPGYEIDDAVFRLILNASNKDTPRIEGNDTDDNSVTDPMAFGSITIQKRSKSGNNRLNGATFELIPIKLDAVDGLAIWEERAQELAAAHPHYISWSTTTTPGHLVVKSGMTQKGDTRLSDLPTGKYRLTETKAPSGYTKDSSSKTVTVLDGENTKVLVKNTKESSGDDGDVGSLTFDDGDDDDDGSPQTGDDWPFGWQLALLRMALP